MSSENPIAQLLELGTKDHFISSIPRDYDNAMDKGPAKARDNLIQDLLGPYISLAEDNMLTGGEFKAVYEEFNAALIERNLAGMSKSEIERYHMQDFVK